MRRCFGRRTDSATARSRGRQCHLPPRPRRLSWRTRRPGFSRISLIFPSASQDFAHRASRSDSQEVPRTAPLGDPLSQLAVSHSSRWRRLVCHGEDGGGAPRRGERNACLSREMTSGDIFGLGPACTSIGGCTVELVLAAAREKPGESSGLGGLSHSGSPPIRYRKMGGSTTWSQHQRERPVEHTAAVGGQGWTPTGQLKGLCTNRHGWQQTSTL